MQELTDTEGHKMIQCTNHSCASNGGQNNSAMINANDDVARYIAYQRWKRRTGISDKMLAKCVGIMTDIVNKKDNKKNKNERATKKS
jgi:hypothetical protein